MTLKNRFETSSIFLTLSMLNLLYFVKKLNINLILIFKFSFNFKNSKKY